MGNAAKALISSLGIPADAIVTDIREPAQLLSSLDEYIRPAIGGLHIEKTGDPGNYCTMGLNITYNGNAAIATAGHCSQRPDVSADSTPYLQPSEAIYPVTLAVETVEASVFSASRDSRCPVNSNLCKWSDFSINYVTDNVSQALSAVGRVARPFARTRVDSSLTFDPGHPFLITNKVLFPFVGDTVDKIGARTGWTYGVVTAACETENAGFSDYYICNHRAALGVGGGDSGAGVFVYKANGDSLNWAGQVWGGVDPIPGKTRRYNSVYFSPVNNIQSELGNVVATVNGW